MKERTEMKTSQRFLQAHCQSPTSQRTDQSFVKELAKPTQNKIVFKKFPDPSKKIKNATHNRQTMTQKLNNDNGLQGRTTEHQLPTAVLQKWRFSASYDSFVVSQSSVLRLKFSGENRHLRKAAKRWGAL
jgi:hypothetical protein